MLILKGISHGKISARDGQMLTRMIRRKKMKNVVHEKLEAQDFYFSNPKRSISLAQGSSGGERFPSSAESNHQA